MTTIAFAVDVACTVAVGSVVDVALICSDAPTGTGEGIEILVNRGTGVEAAAGRDARPTEGKGLRIRS